MLYPNRVNTLELLRCPGNTTNRKQALSFNKALGINFRLHVLELYVHTLKQLCY